MTTSPSIWVCSPNTVRWTTTIVAAASDATYTATYSAQQKSQGLEEIVNRPSSNRKILVDGVLYILRDGKTFTVTGQEVR